MGVAAATIVAHPDPQHRIAGGHLFCLTPRFKSFGNNQSSLLWGHANRHHLAARRRTGRGPSDRQTARVTMILPV